MSLSGNMALYLVLAFVVGLGLRQLRKEDDTPQLNWQIGGVLIGLACALANVAMVTAGFSLGNTFNLDQPLGDTMMGAFGAGLLIGVPVGLMAAYDMSKRFTVIDGWMLGFKVMIVFLVLGGTISSLAVPRYTTQQWMDFMIFGLAQGGIYALIALGYTLVYGILFMINFAHGEVFMSGAFTAFYAANALATPVVEGQPSFLDTYPLISLGIIFAVSMGTSTIVAVLLERIAYRPLRNAPRLVPLITAIGASFFLQYSFRGFYGSGIQTYSKVQMLQGDLLIADLLLAAGIVIVVVVGWGLIRLVAYQPLKKSLGSREWLAPFVVVIALYTAVYFIAPVLQVAFVASVDTGETADPTAAIVDFDTDASGLLEEEEFGLLLAEAGIVSKLGKRVRPDQRGTVTEILVEGDADGDGAIAGGELPPLIEGYPEIGETVGNSATFSETPLPISRIQFVIIVSSIVMMAGLYAIVQLTKIGRAMRAVAEDKDVAALMGVNVDQVITITFALGAALAGAAGVLYALIFGQVQFFMGFLPGLKAFTAAVLGGIGSVPGAMLGGLFLGIVESLGPGLFLEGLGIPAAYQLKDVIAFTMLVLVLIFRPAGIMGIDLSKKKA